MPWNTGVEIDSRRSNTSSGTSLDLLIQGLEDYINKKKINYSSQL